MKRSTIPCYQKFNSHLGTSNPSKEGSLYFAQKLIASFYQYPFKVGNGWLNLTCVAVLLMLTGCSPDRGLVVGNIKKASKLATTEITIDKLVYGVKTKRLFWAVPLGEAQFVAHSQAIIKSGVDLQKLKLQDVSIDGSRISVKLPAVEVLNFSYPAERFYMDDQISGNSFLNKISLRDQEQFFQDAETDIRNSLAFMNITETTEKKTRLMLEIMLRSMGYEEVYIDFHQGKLIPTVPNQP